MTKYGKWTRRVAENPTSTEGMADKNRFADKLTEEAITTVEGYLQESLGGMFLIKQLLLTCFN